MEGRSPLVTRLLLCLESLRDDMVKDNPMGEMGYTMFLQYVKYNEDVLIEQHVGMVKGVIDGIYAPVIVDASGHVHSQAV